VTRRSNPKRNTPTHAPAVGAPLVDLDERLATAVAALEEAERAGENALYRADELLIRVRQLVVRARRVLADTRTRALDGDGAGAPQIPTLAPAPGVHGAPPAELFWRRVDRSGSCWLWTGGVDKDGYGKFQVTISNREPRQQHFRAHRFSFFLAHGRWPVERLLHSCHEPRCVNPEHVSEGTQSENIIHTVLRRTHGTVRATPELVREWRLRHAAGEQIADIARSSELAYSTVEHAVTRRTWRHVA